MDNTEDLTGKIKTYIALLQIMIILSLQFQDAEWSVWQWRSQEAIKRQEDVSREQIIGQ